MHDSQPDLLVPVGDGRRLAVDDRGDPAGAPVLYLHGTPDSRLARHPDDDVAARSSIRLLAVDRPGLGGSDPDPAATPESVADDLARVMDALGIGDCGVLTWSAGSLFGLALAGRHPGRVRRLVLASPLVPADAHLDRRGPDVLDGADDGRRAFASLIGQVDPDEIGAELAAWTVPPGLDEPTARDLLAASLDEVATVAGAGDMLVGALLGAVREGMVGLERDIAAQARPLGRLLDGIVAPVDVVVGDADTVTPPAMAAWLHARLGGTLELVPDAGHAMALLRWSALLVLAGQADAATIPGTSGSTQASEGTSDQSRSSS